MEAIKIMRAVVRLLLRKAIVHNVRHPVQNRTHCYDVAEQSRTFVRKVSSAIADCSVKSGA